RKKSTSESVVPSISGYSAGSTASARSRLTVSQSPISPLCTQSHLQYRKGWQFVCCTGVPVVARTCARKRCDSTWPASSRRLRSFQAGSVLLKLPGSPEAEYHPMPKPSPFVGSAPMRELRLCSIRECCGPYSTLSMRTGLLLEGARHRVIDRV